MFTTPRASVCLGSRGQVEERPGKDKQPNKSSLFSIRIQSLDPGVREALNNDTSELDSEVPMKQTSSQAPSYASPNLCPPAYSLTGVKCRATSVAKNDRRNSGGTLRQKFNFIDI